MLSCTLRLFASLLSEGSFVQRLWRRHRQEPSLPLFPNTHTRTPYSHLMVIFFSCCKTGWLATQREQLPLALGRPGPWPCLQEGVPQGRGISSLLPVVPSPLTKQSEGHFSLAVKDSPEQFDVGMGWWAVGIDGWLCFFICAIVWTILKLHVKGEISIWLVGEKWNHSNICFSIINFFLYKY